MNALFEAASIWLQPIGKKENAYYLMINGHEYGYDMTSTNWGKFLKILQFSQGRALAWLKKNSKLVAGSMKQNESRMADYLHYCNKPMETFVQMRDTMSEPDVTPEYSSFKITKSGAFKAPCVQAAEIIKVANNPNPDFWKKIVLGSPAVPVPAGQYEVLYQEFIDSKDDFLVCIGQYDKQTKKIACYALWSKPLEKSNDVIVTSYVDIPW